MSRAGQGPGGSNLLVLCCNAVDRSRFGFPNEPGKLNCYYLCLVDMSRGHGLLTAAGCSSRTRSKVDGRAALLFGLSAAVRLCAAAPMGQHGPACQVKNTNELFRHMLHMINTYPGMYIATSLGNNGLSVCCGSYTASALPGHYSFWIIGFWKAV